MQDVRGVAPGGGEVVRDHQNGDPVAAVELLHDRVHLLRHLRVKPRDRLVEEQQAPRGAEGAGEEHALLLPAGELPVAAVPQGRESEPLDLLLGDSAFFFSVKGRPATPDAAGEHDLPDRGGEIPLDGGLLREIADLVLLYPVAEAHRAGKRPAQAEQRLHQRGLAGAVLPDDAEVVPLLHRKGKVRENGLALVAEGEIFTYDLCHILSFFPLRGLFSFFGVSVLRSPRSFPRTRSRRRRASAA